MEQCKEPGQGCVACMELLSKSLTSADRRLVLLLVRKSAAASTIEKKRNHGFDYNGSGVRQQARGKSLSEHLPAHSLPASPDKCQLSA